MELIHTCYRIGEIDRSVAFYEALGFEERRRMPIRDEAINVFMGLPGDGDRLELTYNLGVDSYELGTGYNHIALDGRRPRRHAAARSAEKGIEPEKPPYRVRDGRQPDLLRAGSRRLPHRAHRALRLAACRPVPDRRPEASEESGDLLFMPDATAADWAKVFAHAEPLRRQRRPGRAAGRRAGPRRCT